MCKKGTTFFTPLWVFEVVPPGKRKSLDPEPRGRQQLSSGAPAKLSIRDFNVRTRFQCLDLSNWLWQIAPLARPPVMYSPLSYWTHQNQDADIKLSPSVKLCCRLLRPQIFRIGLHSKRYDMHSIKQASLLSDWCQQLCGSPLNSLHLTAQVHVNIGTEAMNC